MRLLFTRREKKKKKKKKRQKTWTWKTRYENGTQDNFAWKVSLVKELFLPHEADMILGIPLSFRRPPDRIAWALTPSGIFTTCSAYKLIVSGAMNSFAGGSNLENYRKFWRGLW